MNNPDSVIKVSTYGKVCTTMYSDFTIIPKMKSWRIMLFHGSRGGIEVLHYWGRNNEGCHSMAPEVVSEKEDIIEGKVHDHDTPLYVCEHNHSNECKTTVMSANTF